VGVGVTVGAAKDGATEATAGCVAAACGELGLLSWCQASYPAPPTTTSDTAVIAAVPTDGSDRRDPLAL
jgi:hypothetical protein